MLGLCLQPWWCTFGRHFGALSQLKMLDMMRCGDAQVRQEVWQLVSAYLGLARGKTKSGGKIVRRDKAT